MIKLTRIDWESYIEQINSSIKVNAMAQKTDAALLEYAKKELAKFPKEKKPCTSTF